MLIFLLRKKMITDIQLGVVANILGVGIFVLVIIYHYIEANNKRAIQKLKEKE